MNEFEKLGMVIFNAFKAIFEMNLIHDIELTIYCTLINCFQFRKLFFFIYVSIHFQLPNICTALNVHDYLLYILFTI